MNSPRRVALLLLAVLVSTAASLAVVVGAVPAGAVTTSGTYHAVTPTRILDTRANPKPVTAGGTVQLPVANRAGVPAGATVVLNVTVTQPTAGGFITVYPGATTRPTASNLNFVRAQTVANLVVVAAGSDGTVELYNGSSGTVQLVADVSGYFTGSAAPSGQGAFGVIAPTRLLDTRGAKGNGRPIGPKQSVSFAVAGNTIPAGVSDVVVNVTVAAPTAGGFVTAYADGKSVPSSSNLNFTAGQTVPNLVVAPVGADGRVALYNGSGGTVQLLADAAGYLLPGDPVSAGAFGGLAPSRVLDTRSGLGAPGQPVGPKKSITLHLGGVAGVPLTQVSAAVLNVTAVTPSAGGYLTVYAAGSTRPTVSNVNFNPGQVVPNLVVAPVSPDGAVIIYNGSGGTIDVLADVSGYLLGADVPLPATSVSRYVTNLSLIADASTSGEGCADASSGPGLVLLDVGAQSVTPPLSPANPGVALARTNPIVRATYPDLVAALDGYLAGFSGCEQSGVTTTIAVGTNNSGAFSGTNAYPAGQRGSDWADQVIDKLAPHTGTKIAGADDIESYFASTEAQAEQWVSSYLGATPADLIDNGSADNCPTAYGSTAECGAVRDENGVVKTWTRAQYVRLAYGLGPGRISVLPQIYYGYQAVEWLNIAATSGKHLSFAGSLTQYGICAAACGLAPSQGWAAFYHALSTAVPTPSLAVATDLQPH